MTLTKLRFPTSSTRVRIAISLSLFALLAACDDGTYGSGPEDENPPVPVDIFTSSGAVADVKAAVDAYKALLGTDNGGTAGPLASGRRNVNWDGVPDSLSNNDSFPGDFFAVRSMRGLITSTPGSGFRISTTGFTDVNVDFGTDFGAFSPARTFMSSGSAITDVTFRVPGQQTPARVSAFGVVFVDVERAGSAVLEAYDAAGTLLGRFTAPVMKTGGPHSFIGVRFQSALVARVRITSGDAALSAISRDVSDGGATDLVVMDDFVYAEPQPRT